jgi:hypothetical protein
MTGKEQKIQSIDTRLSLLRKRRWIAWEASDSDKVSEYTDVINQLLDERIELAQKVTA